MKEFGCIVIRCYTHHLTTGRRITEGLCSGRFHDLCTTDWDPTNQVRGGGLHRSDRSHQRPGKAHSPKQVYHVKEKKEEVQPTIDPEKAKADVVVQIGNIKVVVNDAGTRLMVFDKLVNTPVQRPIMDNDHEANNSNSTSKYFQPRWCPPGLTRTQKRKLQRLRFQEKKEQEFERLRDKQFNHYRPMVPQGKEWRVKVVDQQA